MQRGDFLQNHVVAFVHLGGGVAQVLGEHRQGPHQRPAVTHPEGVAVEVLKNLGIELENLRREVERNFPPASEIQQAGDVPFSQDAIQIFTFAAQEARNMNYNYIGTEHLLLLRSIKALEKTPLSIFRGILKNSKLFWNVYVIRNFKRCDNVFIVLLN